MKGTIRKIILSVSVIVMMFAMTAIVSAQEPTVNVPAKYYGNEKEVTNGYTYNNMSQLSGGQCGVVIPLKVSAPGTLKLGINYTRLEKDVNAFVYTDAACTNQLLIYGNANQSATKKEGYVSVNKAGTYYLKFYSSSDAMAFTNAFTVTVSQYTTADKTIKSGQTICYFRNNGYDKYYFQYKAEKTGKVTVSLPYQHGSYVTLLNAKKKALSEAEWVSGGANTGKFTFAVKKGTTYHFLVTSNGINAGNIQSISVKNTAVKEKSGAKKKKAVKIKAKKTVKGTILPGSKTADWYKFSLKKKKKVTLNFNGNITGGLKITVYTKGGKKIGSYVNNGGSHVLRLTHSRTYGKVDKGTYYIKISRNNSLSSGAYSLKWK